MSRFCWTLPLLLVAIPLFFPLLYFWASSLHLASSISWVFWLRFLPTASDPTECAQWCPPNSKCVNANIWHCTLGFNSSSGEIITSHSESCDGTEAWREGGIPKLWEEIVGPPESSSLRAAQKHFNKGKREVTAQGSMRGIGNQVLVGGVLRSYTAELGCLCSKYSSDTGSLIFRNLFFMSLLHFVYIVRIFIVLIPHPWTEFFFFFIILSSIVF